MDFINHLILRNALEHADQIKRMQLERGSQLIEIKAIYSYRPGSYMLKTYDDQILYVKDYSLVKAEYVERNENALLWSSE